MATMYDQIAMAVDLDTRTIQHVLVDSTTQDQELLASYHEPEWFTMSELEFQSTIVAHHLECLEIACQE